MPSAYVTNLGGPSTIASCKGGLSKENKAYSSIPAGIFTNQKAGNSVLLSSGQFSFRQAFTAIGSLDGVGWSFSLDYLAGNGVDGIVGKGFNFPQNLRLEELPGGNVNVVTGVNTAELFLSTGPGTYAPDAANNSQGELTRAGSGTSDEFMLSVSDGTVSKFFGFDTAIDTPGRLKSITDRYGNVQTYAWQLTGDLDQLVSVTDSYGHTTEYRYYGSEVNYRLREIEDFLGRKLNFQYDAWGHLVAVVTPSILRGAPGNTFPGGTAYVFQYDVNNPRLERRDDLVRIWYPNEATPFIDPAARTVNVAQVYADAVPRYFVEYGQDPTDVDFWGRVMRETVGDLASGVGGTYQYLYTTADLPENIIDPEDPIVFRCVVTDRNGNQVVYDFTQADMPARVEVMRTRSKISIPSLATFPSFVTWTKFNVHNQILLQVFPEGNSTENEYETGSVPGIGAYNRRSGLLLRVTQKPGNSLGIPSRSGSNGQTELTQRFFYDPIFNQQCATIEHRGNPIAAGSVYFTPQNDGSTPTDANRSRYATLVYRDYQKDAKTTVQGDTDLQALLGLDSTGIGVLIDYVDDQMSATDGTGGIPAGFEMNLGDINGDGTGSGAASGLPDANHLGNVVKVKHPSVRLIGAATITTQVREELFTTNARGQTTTYTNPEGNLAVFIRYPYGDPEGDGRFLAPGLNNKQYGRLKETRVDADPNDVMSLVGSDGDLVDFIPSLIERTNTPDVYQNLVTRFEGSSAGGCSSCAYDPLGNVLAQTDARGFTTHYDRNELGEVFRTISPVPYRFQVETYYDANRNFTRIDTEDQRAEYLSDDPTSANYAKFLPSGSGSTAHVPMQAGPGGEIRPGWFTNLFVYDLLENRIEDDIDATGGDPASLVTRYAYDPNQNRITVTKPQGNTVQYDYDERNLRIAEQVGDAPDTPAVTVTAYDGNGNVLQAIGPAQRGGAGNWQTVVIDDAFRSGSSLTNTGDFALENIYDGFDRVIQSLDAAGNVALVEHDPSGRVIATTTQGPVGGATPTDRNGDDNVDLAQSAMRFDEAGRQYEAQQNVFLASGTSVPSGRAITHTGGGLETNSTANGHTGTATLTSGGMSYVLSRTVFDRAGRTTTMLADNTAAMNAAFDGANRRIQETDALGNVTAYEFDPNGNVTFVTRTEKCTITEPEVADEIFRAAMRYDSLNRKVLSAQQGADGSFDLNLATCCTWPIESETLFSLTGYDSRGNPTLAIDPKGNTFVSVYDGASRSMQQIQHLRERGQGSSPPPDGQSLLPYGGAVIRTATTFYDGNSRVLQLVDDRGGVTSFTYDTLDRQTVFTFHDGSTRESAYNAASDVVSYQDENGSVFTNTFDPLGRKTAVSISLAAGVVGTTAQSFEFDGASRGTFTRDSVSGTNADVSLVFDSLSRTLEESQAFDGNTRNVTNSAFTSYPTSLFTFPTGRQITNAFDALYRRTQALETSGNTNIASWEFFGPGRVAEVVLGNGLICSQMNNDRTRSARQAGQSTPAWGDESSDRLGYDGSGRMITKRFLAGGIDGTSHAYEDPTAVVGFTTEFDHASNKFYERHLHAENRSHLYEPFDDEGVTQGGYDSPNRLRQYQRGTLSSTGGQGNVGGGSVSSAITLPNTDEVRTYDLDGLGNWKKTSFEPVGGAPTTELRQHNYLNEITKRDSDLFAYDGAPGASNGNLTDDGERLYVWDALNRLKEVRRKSDDEIIGQYDYDALNRRIRKVVSNGGLSGIIPDGTTDFLYSGWRCIEERDEDNDPTKQHVWGMYLDELIQQKNIVALNNFGTNSLLYPLQDLLYRTTGLSDSAGVIREAYDCDAYGNTLIFRNAGTPPAVIAWDDADAQVDFPTCEAIFTGQRFDAETASYYYKQRYYLPTLGGFASRDPIEGGSDYSTAAASVEFDKFLVPPSHYLTSIQIPIDFASIRSTLPFVSLAGSRNHLGLQRVPATFGISGRKKNLTSVSSNTRFLNMYQYVSSCPIDFLDPLGLQKYGNFCGPGHRGTSAIDQLDTCCQVHDACYEHCGAAGITGFLYTNIEARWCDRQLCVCASAAFEECSHSVSCLYYLMGVISLFCGRGFIPLPHEHPGGMYAF